MNNNNHPLQVIEEVEYLRRNTELMVGIDQKLLNNLLEQVQHIMLLVEHINAFLYFL